MTVNSVISGANMRLIKSGAGTVMLNMPNTYTGKTLVTQGTLSLALSTPLSGSAGLTSVTSPGSGYTSAPTVTITGGGGTGATATATVVGGVVTGVTITNAGTRVSRRSHLAEVEGLGQRRRLRGRRGW
jgi:autotransporter-associated beta strand protein